MTNIDLIKKLNAYGCLSKDEFVQLVSTFTAEDLAFARGLAVEISKQHFKNNIYIRGLIEFTNICKQNCIYCGIRCANNNANRYRLSKEEILDCCRTGYPLGFRSFVLQGGEDPYYTDDIMCDIISSIRAEFPDCAITLSIGEKSRETYQRFFDAGADRYLLRHETANAEHYSKLHPAELTLENRKRCLFDLKEIGFQTGCGFMVGSPYQTPETIADDLLFIHELDPQMAGIGPFIPHKDTPFAKHPAGGVELTLFLLALVRIMQKNILLPSTTALGTVKDGGRKLGVLSGANVVMPNLSPIDNRKKYMIYDNKLISDSEAAEGLAELKAEFDSIGYQILVSRGDYK